MFVYHSRNVLSVLFLSWFRFSTWIFCYLEFIFLFVFLFFCFCFWTWIWIKVWISFEKGSPGLLKLLNFGWLILYRSILNWIWTSWFLSTVCLVFHWRFVKILCGKWRHLPSWAVSRNSGAKDWTADTFEGSSIFWMLMWEGEFRWGRKGFLDLNWLWFYFIFQSNLIRGYWEFWLDFCVWVFFKAFSKLFFSFSNLISTKKA